MPQVVSYLTPVLLILFWLFVVDGFNSGNFFKSFKDKIEFSNSSEEATYPLNGIYEKRFESGELQIKGNFKNGSDIDLCILSQTLNYTQLAKIELEL